jgi:hypothetical protein
MVIGFVEKWSERQDPSPTARLAQAEAFLRLRLMDKAWVRLKSLTDEGLCGVKPHVLSARMFIDRGWASKARKVIQEGLERSPDHADLLRLLDEAAVEPPPVDTARADAADASVAELVDLAEHFMAQGAFVRARSLLERARRSDPEHRRGHELLRAIDGRFSVDEPLGVLVDRHGPPVPSLPDLNDDADHTESASLDNLPHGALEREENDPHFPALFRGLSAREAAADDGEVTAVSSLAEMRAMLESASDGRTEERGDDTQIMRVVHRGGVEPVGAGAVHRETPEPDANFNLADFRREMGMSPPRAASDLDLQVPEDEDDSVVMRTQVSSPAEAPESAAITEIQSAVSVRSETGASPREASPKAPPVSAKLKREAEDEALAARAQGTSEDDVWADLSEGHQQAATRAAESPPKAPMKAPPPPPSRPQADTLVDDDDEAPSAMAAWPWWVAVLLLLMGVAFGVFFVLVLLMLLS